MDDITRLAQSLVAMGSGVRMQAHMGKHPADNFGLWYFSRDDSSTIVQVESGDGMVPFLVENTTTDERFTVTTVNDAARIILSLLNR